MIIYADTSALGSVYLGDEADASWLSDVLFSGPDQVVTAELTDVELASLLRRAVRNGRIDDAGLRERLTSYEAHSADDGPLGIVPLTSRTVARAREFVLQTAVRSLDALHLAAADTLADGAAEVLILTRDRRQAEAAAALAFTLHPRSAR